MLVFLTSCSSASQNHKIEKAKGVGSLVACVDSHFPYGSEILKGTSQGSATSTLGTRTPAATGSGQRSTSRGRGPCAKTTTRGSGIGTLGTHSRVEVILNQNIFQNILESRFFEKESIITDFVKSLFMWQANL